MTTLYSEEEENLKSFLIKRHKYLRNVILGFCEFLQRAVAEFKLLVEPPLLLPAPVELHYRAVWGQELVLPHLNKIIKIINLERRT